MGTCSLQEKALLSLESCSRISAIDRTGDLTIYLGQGANLKKVYVCSDLSWSPSTMVLTSVKGNHLGDFFIQLNGYISFSLVLFLRYNM